MFKLKKDEVGLESTKPIKCVFCGSEMVLRRVITHSTSTGGYANDMSYKCVKCGWYTTFGVPLPREHAEKLIDQRGAGLDPVPGWEKNKEIKRKLEEIGYW